MPSLPYGIGCFIFKFSLKVYLPFTVHSHLQYINQALFLHKAAFLTISKSPASNLEEKKSINNKLCKKQTCQASAS